MSSPSVLTIAVLVVLGLGLAVHLRLRAAAEKRPSPAWALDLGTTNTLLARWDAVSASPRVLDLPALGRRPLRSGTEELARGVPSALQVLDEPSYWARLGLGKLATIGQPALDANQLQPKLSFVSSFKRALSFGPLQVVARTPGGRYTARDAAHLFLRELLADAGRAAGRRVRDLVVTTPVEAFESYRAELTMIGKRLGLTRLRFIDEPVAAALGYGLGLSRDRKVLVVDFGGGTLHLALVALTAAQVQEGRAQVLAKASADAGGNLVDAWVLDEFAQRLSWPLEDDASDEELLWQRLMLAEACRVKEAVYFDEKATFEVSLPETRQRFEQRLLGQAPSLDFTQGDLARLLEQRGLYRQLNRCVTDVLDQARAAGLSSADVDDVLMVGGSTLLPGVFSILEQRFGREKVRAWQPFEAVALGAAAFAAGQAAPKDFIVHDYALLTYDEKTKQAEHAIVIPRRTRFPTAPDFWKQQLVPTCGLGEPEKVFKLVVCEIGSGGGASGFTWDADGKVRRVKEGDAAQVIVKLNEASPAIGHLDPPHSARDRTPRLEVSFGVNADRWLCSTVRDLRTGKQLMCDEPVVKLL